MSDKIDVSKKNGVYLFEIESVNAGYVVKSTTDETFVENVKAHDNIIGTADSFEVECNDYEIEDGTLYLFFGDAGSVLSQTRK